MNLMSWMHRKLQNDNSSSKISSVGNSCSCFPLKSSLSDQDAFIKPRTTMRPQTKQDNQQPIDEFKDKRTEEYVEEADSEVVFPGFLTIGTLNLEQSIPESVTPTFVLPLEETTVQKRNLEDVKLDLELVSKKVEMILKTEADQLSNEESKGEIQVLLHTTGLCSNKEENQGDTCIKLEACPKRGYLLHGSSSPSILPGKSEEVDVLNTSFHEMVRVADTGSKANSQDIQQQHGKKFRSPKNFMRKMLQAVQPISASADTTKSTPMKKKFNKMQQIFGKKVHPDPNEAKEFSKKHQMMTTPNPSDFPGGYPRPQSEIDGKFNCRATELEKDNYTADLKLPRDMVPEIHLGFPPKDISSSRSNQSEEHWIDTDEDYLVLELQKNEGDGY